MGIYQCLSSYINASVFENALEDAYSGTSRQEGKSANNGNKKGLNSYFHLHFYIG